jgi:hypothetical protein
VLAAASVADDLGYIALADLSRVVGEVTTDYRVIGGHMITVLAARWRLGAELTGKQATLTWGCRRSWRETTVLSAG